MGFSSRGDTDWRLSTAQADIRQGLSATCTDPFGLSLPMNSLVNGGWSMASRIAKTIYAQQAVREYMG